MSVVSAIFKKSIAAFLLVLLVIVFANKAFHHHTTDRYSNHLTISVNSDDCAICEFELAKDADIVLPLDIQVFPLTGQIILTALCYEVSAKGKFGVSDRAPPVFYS